MAEDQISFRQNEKKALGLNSCENPIYKNWTLQPILARSRMNEHQSTQKHSESYVYRNYHYAMALTIEKSF